MSDSISKDDKKFEGLFQKQSSDNDWPELKPEGKIEEDDSKLDHLLFLQDIAQGQPEHASIEEKYEEEILINQVTKMLDGEINKQIDEEDAFTKFFNKPEDEE
jgi:hypothetical protein